jgi:hypothetical protein
MRTLSDLSPESRLWIYQSDRFLTDAEAASILNETVSFLQAWTSHDKSMLAAAEVISNRFLLIGADETQAEASGCGIDKLVRFVQALGQKWHVDFFKRTQVIYMLESSLTETELHTFWGLRKAGVVDDHTLVFDNTIRKVGDLNGRWKVPFSQSWHAEMWLR